MRQVIIKVKLSILKSQIWRRLALVVIVVLLPLLSLQLLHASVLSMAPDYPWVLFPLIEAEGIYDVAIDGYNIAWIEGGSESPILIKNLQTGEVRSLADQFPCPAYTGYYANLDLEGDWIVATFSCDGVHEHEVQALNLTTNELVLIQPPNPLPTQFTSFAPVISGNRIVWYEWDLDDSLDLYLYDLQTRVAISLTNNGGPVFEVFPDIDGDWVVWDSYNRELYEHSIVAYNLASSEQITLPITNYPYYPFPTISESIIVWGDYRQGDDNGDIYGYNLDTRQEFPIITTTADHYTPLLDGDLLVYREKLPDYELAIYAYDMDSSESAFVDRAQSSYYELTMNNDLIAWINKTVAEPETIYGARALPERIYLPLAHQGSN